MLRLVVKTLRLPLQQGVLQAWVHRQQLRRCFHFGALQMPTSTPMVRVLQAEAQVFEIAVEPPQSPEFPLTYS
jgi:hypothetical protein